jgi:uncharacterized membrane protein
MKYYQFKYIIWILYSLAVGLSILGSLSNLLMLGCSGALDCLIRWEDFRYVFAILIILGHGIYTIGWRKTCIFVLLASGVGFVSEYLGLHYGQSVGAGYAYRTGYATILEVPVLILLFWSFFIYTAYTITNSLLAWAKRKKPESAENDFHRIWRLAAIDALLVLFIDVFMEPIMVARGDWHWLDKGYYFSIPLGNFIGWYLVAFVSMFIFRSIEYKLNDANKLIDNDYLLMPVIGYALIAFDFMIAAILLDLPRLILIGFPLMSGVAVYNLFNYFRFKRKFN